ncbi:MAG TPA: DUF4440 domain-containing protein [Solirubrobacteraceae bacterium]|jgi:ribonuclease HI
MTDRDQTLDHVVALEQQLLDPETRRDPARVRSLLHSDFREVGASGTVWDRDGIVAALEAEPGTRGDVRDIVARHVAPGVVLVTYDAADTRRSSLWIRDESGWRVLFHQGTPIV